MDTNSPAATVKLISWNAVMLPPGVEKTLVALAISSIA
jgi:hypothetical protein